LPSDTRTLTSRTWLTEAIGATVFLLVLGIILNMMVDIYGLFRNAKGRHLVVYGDERIAKYLLSERYVPENFNALLLGSSVTANWNTSGIEGLRVYNESVVGGHSVEEKAIADQALRSPSIRVVVLTVHPYLTASHEFETFELTPKRNLSAFGSQSLLDAYKSKVRIMLHLEPQAFDEFGTNPFGNGTLKMNAHLQELMYPGTDFNIDQIAMKSYQDLIDELHRANIHIIYVIPPVSQSIFVSKSDAFSKYSSVALENKLRQDQVIDFTSDEFLDFRRNRNNFSDGVHLKDRAAHEVVVIINDRINRWIRDGQLK
jgi:hypothetical protein